MISLALRNLARHRRRTAIALAAIAFGVIALLLVGGFVEWAFWGMREGVIQSRTGHIQMTRPGYFELGSADPYDYLLPDSLDEQVDLESVPEISVVSPRLAITGLISHDELTTGFIGEGVDPGKDAALSQHLIISAGDRLAADDPSGLLLGAGLAETLGVSAGDALVILVTPGAGGINGIDATVRGVFHSASKEFDTSALRMPLATARQLLRVDGAHTRVMLLDQTEHTDRVLQELQNRYPLEQVHVEFTPWYQLADFYNKTVKLFSRQMDMVRLVVALIIVLSISNTLVMTVLERTGEIGTLMAIGFRRRHILQLFVSEGVLLGLIGGGLGGCAGVVLAHVISAIGIPMPPPPGVDVEFAGRIMITWTMVAGVIALALFTTLLGSLYPAWKASRLQIVNALRHNH